MKLKTYSEATYEQGLGFTPWAHYFRLPLVRFRTVNTLLSDVMRKPQFRCVFTLSVNLRYENKRLLIIHGLTWLIPGTIESSEIDWIPSES